MRFPTEFLTSLTRGRIIRVLSTLIFLVLGTMLICAGGYLGQKYYEPQVVVKYELVTVDRIVEKVVYTPVERVIETVVYEPVETVVYEPIDKIIVEEIEVPRSLDYFESLVELKQWLNDVKFIDIHFDVVDRVGNNIKKFDCDDYAIELQDRALQQGYILSFEVIGYNEYNSLFNEKKIPYGAIHAINSAIIGNEVYYIEPQTQETVFVANLD